MALMVPEILLVVATSEGVLTSIERAFSLFEEDASDSSSSSTDGSEDSFDFDVLVESTYNPGSGDAGEHSFDFEFSVDSSGEASFGPGAPLDTTGDEQYQYTFLVPMDTSGNVEHADDHGEASNVTPDHEWHKAGSIDYWADTLASALAPDGLLTSAHREITRLVTLHGVAVRLLNLCVSPHGDEAAWKRWRGHREAVVLRAHDALLKLSSATSATAAAEDFLRLRSVLSPHRSDWPSEAKRLVCDARRDVDEAWDAVMLMRDAAARQFFETWMILKASQPLQRRPVAYRIDPLY
uniref:Uncharacterized protein n=2 Tax=Oryza brachyantha TaxID=4533 RepID=J3KWL0_ORYBR